MILACLKVGPNLVVYHEFLRCTIVWKHPVLGENLIIGFGCIIISSHIQQYIPFETLISPYKYVYIYRPNFDGCFYRPMDQQKCV